MLVSFPAVLILGHDSELARWAGERVGIADFGPCAAIGVAHKGSIVAAAVYNNYSPPNIHVTFVTSSPRWASKGAIRAIFRYPFVQLNCRRVTAVTGAMNQPARAFLCRLGFIEEGRHPEAMPSGEDAISYGLLRKHAARWIAEEPPHVEGRPASARP